MTTKTDWARIFRYEGTGEQAEALAIARQTLAHEGTGYVPSWEELTDEEREGAAVHAAHYLTAMRMAGMLAKDDDAWDLWADIGTLTAWLDANNGDRAPDLTLALRVLKLSKEVGEVAQALIGVTGQNPRKGVSHTADDLAGELCDAIVTAMVALNTLTGNPSVSRAHLASKVTSCLARAKETS